MKMRFAALFLVAAANTMTNCPGGGLEECMVLCPMEEHLYPSCVSACGVRCIETRRRLQQNVNVQGQCLTSQVVDLTTRVEATELYEARIAAIEDTLGKCDPCSASDPWNLVMKMQEASGTFSYHSSYWEDTNLLNASSPKSTAEDAKYASFLQGPVDAIRICTDAPHLAPNARCMEHQLPRVFASPLELFQAGYISDDTIDQSAMYGIFEPHSKLHCGMVLPGFNIYGSNDGSYARFGFMGNIPSQDCDNGDDDWALGIGIDQNASVSCAYGAGVTCHWNDNNAGPKTWDAWVYFRTTPQQPPSPFGAGWDIVMKSAKGSGIMAYDASWWTDQALLDENSNPEQAGDAKYAAFGQGPVDKIRICTDFPYGHSSARCYEHTLPSTYSSARDLFSAGYIEDQTIDKMAMYSIFSTHPRQDCDMVQPGFNSEATNDFSRTRFGFMGQIPSQDCDPGDDDWAMGIGIDQKGGVSCAFGSGVTCHWADANNAPESFDAWVYFHMV